MFSFSGGLLLDIVVVVPFEIQHDTFSEIFQRCDLPWSWMSIFTQTQALHPSTGICYWVRHAETSPAWLWVDVLEGRRSRISRNIEVDRFCAID